MLRSERGATGPRILLAVVVLLAAGGIVAIRVAGHGGEPDVGRTQSIPAPNFQGIAAWINTPPLTITQLHGKVVLVDFWTYSCINCLRTIPGLRALYQRYAPDGLQLVGVHTPEFSFEKVQSNVRAAVKRLDVTWPVAMDNDMATWNAYGNNYWPHVYLIDRTGVIRYDHIGEGDEAQIESHIRALLLQGSTTPLPSPVALPEPSFASNMTPEIYLGYERGQQSATIANPQGYAPDRDQRYTAPSSATLAQSATTGGLYLDGTWLARPEYLQSRAADRLFLPFFARNVYIVAAAPAPVTVHVLLDGRAVAAPGADVHGGAVTIGPSRLYALVALPQDGTHLLTLDVPPGLQIYTFTFG
jgi:thiol-disulfide isomerase/thioredoxin